LKEILIHHLQGVTAHRYIMTTPTGMAIDPSLVFSGQFRPGQQQQQQQQTSPSAGGSMLKQEDDTPQKQQQQENHDDIQNYNNTTSTDVHMSQDAQSTAPNGSTFTSTSVKPEAEQVQEQGQALEMPLDLRDDAELATFLARMDDYDPILPDSVTRFYLEKAGFQSSDDRV
jgi:transcription initiation factor TFIID subunit 10